MPVTDDLGGDPSEEEVAQDRLDSVLPSIEATVGERFGGLWLDDTSGYTVAVAVVRPTQEDVDRIGDLARSVGWRAEVCGVRYSQAELDRFVDRLGDLMATLRSDHWVSVHWSPTTNRVEVHLSRAEPGLMRTLTESIPEDALLVRIIPGARFESLQGATARDRRAT